MLTRTLALAAILLAPLSISVGAQTDPQEARAPDSLTLRLDQATPHDEACRLVFVLQNEGARGIDSFQAETVLLSPQNRVLRLTLLDFQALPAGTMRVRSFDLPNLECRDVGQVLINAIASCAPFAVADCQNALRVSSDTDVEVLK